MRENQFLLSSSFLLWDLHKFQVRISIGKRSEHEYRRQTYLFRSGQLASTAIANIEAFFKGHTQPFANQTVDMWVGLLYFYLLKGRMIILSIPKMRFHRNGIQDLFSHAQIRLPGHIHNNAYVNRHDLDAVANLQRVRFCNFAYAMFFG